MIDDVLAIRADLRVRNALKREQIGDGEGPFLGLDTGNGSKEKGKSAKRGADHGNPRIEYEGVG